MKKLIAFLFAFFALAAVAASAAPKPGQLFDSGWKFLLDAPANAQEPTLDDASWRALDLPHDWSIEFAAVADAPAGNAGGFFPTGIGWYRKHYT